MAPSRQTSAAQLLADAKRVLVELGMPRTQQNDRSALCLLALLDLTPGKAWSQATAPLMGITPIMDWARQHYGKDYAPNTRETRGFHPTNAGVSSPPLQW